MGLSYQQIFLIGFELEESEYKTTVREAVYEDQPRYSVKTGQITSYNKVLVRESEESYEFFGVKETDEEDFRSLLSEALEKVGLILYVDKNCDSPIYYIGIDPLESLTSHYQTDLLDDRLGVEEVGLIASKVSNIFPNRDIELIFVSSVG